MVYYPNFDVTLFLSRAKIHSKDKDMLVYRLNSSAAHKLLPGGKRLLTELENQTTSIPNFPMYSLFIRWVTLCIAIPFVAQRCYCNIETSTHQWNARHPAKMTFCSKKACLIDHQ